MTLRAFPIFDEINAPADVREPLARTKRAFGGIPAPLARYAGSPRMMLTALAGLDTFERSALDALEREVLAMTMGRHNDCKFCIEHHRRLLGMQQAPPTLIEALAQGAPLENRRLEALRGFILSALDRQGDVTPAAWTSFREAGYTHEQALDVLLGIGVYTLTTFANRLTETSE